VVEPARIGWRGRIADADVDIVVETKKHRSFFTGSRCGPEKTAAPDPLSDRATQTPEPRSSSTFGSALPR
jgi:hypothetical protein